MPRKYRELTYARILQAIRSRRIVVDVKAAKVWKDGKLLRQRPDSRDRYLFVRLYFEGARRAVAVHRIVWMARRLKCVPDGYDIHHRDGNKRNNNYRNLRAISSHAHRVAAGRLRHAYPADWDSVVDADAEWEYFLTGE